MDLMKSIFSLTKYNNGMFKSQKQSDFLIKMLGECGDLVGHQTVYSNSRAVLAKYDNEGIIKLISVGKGKDKVIFERKVVGVLTELEKSDIKSYERKIKKIQKSIDVKQSIFDSGDYNGSCGKIPYKESVIELYYKIIKDKQDTIDRCRKAILEINNS